MTSQDARQKNIKTYLQCGGDINNLVSLGWQCPKCHKIYSPEIKECEGCNGGK